MGISRRVFIEDMYVNIRNVLILIQIKNKFTFKYRVIFFDQFSANNAWLRCLLNCLCRTRAGTRCGHVPVACRPTCADWSGCVMKRAFVSIASSYVGFCVASVLRQHGYDVVGSCRAEGERT